VLRVNEARPREERGGGSRGYQNNKSLRKSKYPYSGGGNY
jgi:hypothetical protein